VCGHTNDSSGASVPPDMCSCPAETCLLGTGAEQGRTLARLVGRASMLAETLQAPWFGGNSAVLRPVARTTLPGGISYTNGKM
jgi:hypothetical protein